MYQQVPCILVGKIQDACQKGFNNASEILVLKIPDIL